MQLSRLLESEFRHLVEAAEKQDGALALVRSIFDLRTSGNEDAKPRSTRPNVLRERFLDFEKFHKVYWQHFPQDLVKGLSTECHLVVRGQS